MRKLGVFVVLMAVCTAALTIQGSTVRAANTTRYVASSGSDTANDCTSKQHPCATVQHAVDVATSGDAISLGQGTYVEQVTISKSLTLSGADDKSVIKAPAVMVPDTEGKTNIVEITGSTTTVSASHLVVAGPIPATGCGSSASGVAIIGGATLDIEQAAVRDIVLTTPSTLGGCQDGNGIRAGTQAGSATPEVGHLIASHVVVTNYQKNGIVVRGTGSTGQIDHNTVQTTPSPYIGSNGIEVYGGTATVDHNTVTGNECNLVGSDSAHPICGPALDPNQQNNIADGILVGQAGAGTVVTQNDVHGNDIGIYDDSLGTIDHNDVGSNRYYGMFLDAGFTGTVDHNNADGANYGIFLNSGAGGTYTHDSAHNNNIYDLYWSAPYTPTPTFDQNECGTASPNKAAWDCR